MNIYSSIKLELSDMNSKNLYYNKGDFSNLTICEKIFSKMEKTIMSRPACLTVETVNICNHNCIFCPYSVSRRQKFVMPFNLFKKIISDYLKIGGGLLSLTPMLGDIFFDDLLLDRLQYLEKYSKDIQLSVTTNGVLSSKYTDLELSYILNQFKRVQISIYGLKKDEYTQITKKNSYDQFITALHRIISLIHPEKLYFGFRFLFNHSEEEIQKWIIDNCNAMIPYSSTTEYNNWGCSKLPQHLPGDAFWSIRKMEKGPCLIPMIAMQIFVNGNVSMCACADYDSSDELKLGSVLKNSLESMINSNKMESFFTDPWESPQFSKNCSFFRPILEIEQRWIDDPVSIIGG